MKKYLDQLNDYDLRVVLWIVRFYYARHIIRKTFPHWFRAPRMIYLASYLFIIWVVMATVILIATQNIQAGVILFGLFVIPLYAITRYASGFSKRAHWVGKYVNL